VKTGAYSLFRASRIGSLLVIDKACNFTYNSTYKSTGNKEGV